MLQACSADPASKTGRIRQRGSCWPGADAGPRVGWRSSRRARWAPFGSMMPHWRSRPRPPRLRPRATARKPLTGGLFAMGYSRAQCRWPTDLPSLPASGPRSVPRNRPRGEHGCVLRRTIRRDSSGSPPRWATIVLLSVFAMVVIPASASASVNFEVKGQWLCNNRGTVTPLVGARVELWRNARRRA